MEESSHITLHSTDRKFMKKTFLLLLLIATSWSVKAQTLEAQEVLSFFDKNGTVRMETEELDAAADTLVVVQHRKDDIVWARVVYRIIDMRYKQNYQLYFPIVPDDPTYMSLYRLILSAIEDGMPIYQPDSRNFKPLFNDSTLLTPEKFRSSTAFWARDAEGGMPDDTQDETFMVRYDSVNHKINLDFDRYSIFIKNQLKYMVQEVIFFDKHTSRMHRQIIAIAPMQPDEAGSRDPFVFMRESIRFWILYQDLRPYLAKNYIIPIQNETKRVTFDDFFQKRLFTSYLVGEGNMYNRMILEYAKTMEEAQKEQARIEWELLSFEQDLWEY